MIHYRPVKLIYLIVIWLFLQFIYFMTENLNISDFDYHLPDDKIAKYPADRRDQSKLLVYKKGIISDDHFKNIISYIPDDHLLVFNNTRVIQARLLFKKTTGAEIEIFCLEPVSPSSYQDIFNQKKTCIWRCMIGNLKKWKDNELKANTEINGCNLVLTAKKLNIERHFADIEFSWSDDRFSFGEILEQAGLTPIPPYLNRNSEEIDRSRYQTIYSKSNGSVAAPTAGLHFTEEVMQTLKNRNIAMTEITLHVGAGTFRPVSSADISDHEMHTEHYSVSMETLELLNKYRGKILTVGTTSLRALESIYWTGVKILNHCEELKTGQWDYKNSREDIECGTSLAAIENYIKSDNSKVLNNSTQIMITPGYKFRMTNGLITNFHQPKSTLLLLVAAMTGEGWKKIYDHALENDYRFLSYGDSSIIFSAEC